MAGLKLRISLWSFGKNTQYLLALSFLMVAQLVAGCTGVVVPRSQATPQGTLSITSSSLPSGKAQTAYTARLTATGGTAPYTWSLASGSLPAGLTLSSSSGQISGMPSQAESSSFSVEVEDSSSPAQIAKEQLSIAVAAVTISVPITSSPAPSGQVGAPSLIAITVSPNIATVATGKSQQFSGTVTGTSNTAVAWSLSGTGCVGVACGTISASGLYAPPVIVPSPEIVTVKATSLADPTKSASAIVTIVAVISVLASISPTTAAVPTNGTQLFRATVTGTSNTAVSWSLTGPGCSGSACGTLSTSGSSVVYSAPIVAPSPATVRVVASSVADPTKSAAAGITVDPTTVVNVTPTNLSVTTGSAQQFAASVRGTPNTAVVWTVSGIGCSGPACGTISSSGLYTAPKAEPSSATFTITATSVLDSSRSASAEVTVIPPQAAGANYYVNAETGDDKYDGTSPTYISGNIGPWLTLHKAGLTAIAGATVHVADGTYEVNGTIGSPSSIETKNSGTANAWITYVSDNKWGAKIINTNPVNAPNNIAWLVRGDYQIVQDFDISGGPYTGIFVDGNHVRIIGNHLHDISSASCVYGSFVYVNSPYQYVDSIGNVMHDGGMTPWPSDCGLWHGIYYGGVTIGPVQYGQISNNIIYRVSGYGIHFWHKVSHIDVVNNLIFSNVKGGILIGASDGSTNDYFNISNNIVIYNSNMIDNSHGPASLGWGISQYVNGGQIGPHNTYLNNLLYENHASNGWGGSWSNQAESANPTGVISGTIRANPLLVNYQNSPRVPTIANGKVVFADADYHPTPASPAKDTGNVSVAPATNIDGVLWPQEKADIGPY
jgi:hypothetical protein